MKTVVILLSGLSVVLLMAVIFILNYNAFVRLEKKVEEAFSTMDIYLVKRWEMIPKLVNAVKGVMTHERETLTEIAEVRNRSYEGMSGPDKIRANTIISEKLGHVVLVAEDYPELRSGENFLELSRALYQVEDEIAQARKYYNGTVRMFNTKVETFPGMIFAKLYHFQPKEMYEAEPIRRQDVEVRI